MAAGQTATILGLLSKLGGSAYVLESSAADLVATGQYCYVQGTPVIGQPVHAASHLRHRTSRLHRQLLDVVHASFASPDGT